MAVFPPDIPMMRTRKTRSVVLAEFLLPRNFSVPRHQHTPPHLLVMLDGALREALGHEPVVICAGSLRYSPGGDAHEVNALSDGAHCVVIEAFGFPELRLTQRIYAAPEDVAADVNGFRRLLLEASEASPAAVESAALQLFSLVRERSRDGRARRHGWVKEIRRRLDEPRATTRPLADAALHVRRSDGLVARAFRAENGVSVDWYRRRRQIDRAWTLLADAAHSLSDVAATSGFSDQSHMTRVFVREVGETPARLRRRMLAMESARHWFRTVPVTAIGPGA